MSIQSVILKGGVDLVSSRQDSPAGTLRNCKNFEVANRDGYQESKGIRSYSGGVVNDPVDPYVLYTFSSNAFVGRYGENCQKVSGTLDAQYGYVVKWGSGGNYNVTTGTLSEVDGSAVVCYSRQPGTDYICMCLANIKGRLPAPGDIIISDVISLILEMTKPPILASELARDNGFDIFDVDDVTGFDYTTGTVDAASELISAFDMGADYNLSEKIHAYPVPSNPLGSIAGGFYFRDEAYVIADIETWSFNSGSSEPSAGDTLAVFYVGTAPTGSYIEYVVERVFTESGDWNAGTAAGKIELVLNVTVATYMNSVETPTDTRNDTTATNNPLTLLSLARSKAAALWKEGPSASGSAGGKWVRQDLGHEVRFNAGDNYPTVLNRSNRNVDLEATVTTTDWTFCGTAAGWTNSSNAQGSGTGTWATQSNDGVVRPPLTCTNFGFNLPGTAVVLGIEMRFVRRKTVSTIISCRDREVRLTGVPGVSQDKKKLGFWDATSTLSATYGAANDMWGTSLSADIVNDSTFGVTIAAEAVNGSGGTDREIDTVEMRITYKDRSSVVYFGDSATTAITSITRSSSTATVTTTAAHGFTTGQTVTHAGANQAEYNISAVIAVTGLSTYTYTVSGTPATPATGTITAFRDFSTGRVIWYHKKKGDWSTNDAQGTLTMYSLSAATAIKAGQKIRTAAAGGGTVVATVTSAAEKVYLPSSNALETNGSQWGTKQHNFFGAVGLDQVFAVSGAGFGNSWDGTYWIRYRTGVEESQDMPRHVVIHGDQLGNAYISGQIIFSDAGYPESYAAVVGGTQGGSSPISDDTTTYLFAGGAQEVRLGDAVYGMEAIDRQTTFVGCKNSRRLIIGTAGALISDIRNPKMGIIEGTMVSLGRPIFTDSQGVKMDDGTMDGQLLSAGVHPWLSERTQEVGGALGKVRGPLGAYLIRNKMQYRLVFRNREQLTITLRDGAQSTFQELPFSPAVVFTGTTTGGKDMMFLAPYGMAEFGAYTNTLKTPYEADAEITPHASLYAPSFVYQGEVGVTWDLVLPIDRFIEINGTASGREFQNKKYDRAIFSGLCYGFAPFGVSFGTDFGDIETTVHGKNAGSTSAVGVRAFSEQYFSVTKQVGRDGFALSIKFIASGSSVYGATSAQTSPYKFRPMTLQSVMLISEDSNTRR